MIELIQLNWSMSLGGLVNFSIISSCRLKASSKSN